MLFSWYNACLACPRPSVPSPTPKIGDTAGTLQCLPYTKIWAWSAQRESRSRERGWWEGKMWDCKVVIPSNVLPTRELFKARNWEAEVISRSSGPHLSSGWTVLFLWMLLCWWEDIRSGWISSYRLRLHSMQQQSSGFLLETGNALPFLWILERGWKMPDTKCWVCVSSY